jgi:hypothetical protein
VILTIHVGLLYYRSIDSVAWESQVEFAGFLRDLDPQAKVEYSVKADGTVTFSAVLAAAIDRGNTIAGDGYLYRGMGYIQPTGKGNYAKFMLRNGLKLAPTAVDKGDSALKPENAAYVAVLGVKEGRFIPGYGTLAEVIPTQENSESREQLRSRLMSTVRGGFYYARQMVNGGFNHVEEMRDYAIKFWDILS